MPILTARCKAAEELHEHACNEIEDLPMEEVGRLVRQAQDALERAGVHLTLDVWNDPVQLQQWMNKVRGALGCPTLDSSSEAIARAQAALHHGGPAWFCGPGHGHDTFGAPGVARCLNEACERHDSCYARCSKPTNLLCAWSSPTDPCDQDFFDRAYACDFDWGTKIDSWLVLVLAEALKAAPGTGIGCPDGIHCPSGDAQGFGPCATDRKGAACKDCLANADVGGHCLREACQSGVDPCVNDACAGSASEDICYSANCPDVQECFGGGCTAGASRPCTCPSGSRGTQSCSGSSWSVCEGCAPMPCKPGEVQSCACAGGTSGKQTCNSSGTGFGPCGMCTGAPCPDGPQCAGKACGASDSCGGICTKGTCTKPGDSCIAGKCSCTPTCTKCGGADGCGGICLSSGSCDPGFACSAGSCAVDPTSFWQITITNGSIPVDKDWNITSAPDAMACLWIAGARVCTQDAGDTLAPVWGCTFPPVQASTLLAGIDAETFDNDRFSAGTCAETLTSAPGDAICTKGTVHVTEADFKVKTWSFSCAPLMTVNAILTPL